MAKLRKKAVWVVSSSAFAALCQLLLLAVMARLLSVEQLGLYALVLVFLNIAMVIQDGGVGAYLVHKQNLPRSALGAMYLLCLASGFTVALLIIIIAPYIAAYYQQPSLPGLLKPVAATLFISSIISSYQSIALIGEKQAQLAKFDIASRTVGTATALLSLPAFGLEAVLYSGLLTSVIKLLLLVKITSREHQPTWHITTEEMTSALRYGFYQTNALLINQFRTRSDQLIIGKFIGLEALAIYSLAKELINHPTRFITPVIQNVLFPELAEKQNNVKEQLVIMKNSTSALAWVNTLIYSAMAILALPIVWLLYGSAYVSSAGILCILCCYGMLRTIGANYVSYAQAFGRSDLEFKWNLIAAALMVLLVWLATLTQSIHFTAMVLTLSQLGLSWLGFYFFSHALSNLRQVPFYSITVIPICLTLLASVIGYWFYG